MDGVEEAVLNKRERLRSLLKTLSPPESPILSQRTAVDIQDVKMAGPYQLKVARDLAGSWDGASGADNELRRSVRSQTADDVKVCQSRLSLMYVKKSFKSLTQEPYQQKLNTGAATNTEAQLCFYRLHLTHFWTKACHTKHLQANLGTLCCRRSVSWMIIVCNNS